MVKLGRVAEMFYNLDGVENFYSSVYDYSGAQSLSYCFGFGSSERPSTSVAAAEGADDDVSDDHSYLSPATVCDSVLPGP